jgi:hypothetical protein
MDQRWLTFTLLLASSLAAQQPAPATPATATPATDDTSAKPIPPVGPLLLAVERNEKANEAARKDYTYHVHLETQDLDHNGNVKKTESTDSESITVDGVRIDRVVAKDGKPLTAKEQQKESDRVDKEVAKAKERRAKHESQGKETNSRGDDILPASRILELGTFTNPRRVDLNGRPTIVFDYAGDTKAKTRNAFEGIVRDLVGTVWVDEQDRVLARGEGHFLNDFKIGGGLFLNIHKGLSFDFRATKINGEVWLPTIIEGQGGARIFLVYNGSGRFRLVTSDYKKFHTSSTIIQSDRLIGPDGQPIPDQPPDQPPTEPTPPAVPQPPTPQP